MADPQKPVTGVVGRRNELSRVDAFLDAARAGPAALLLEGDPGIGKTSVWRAAVDRGARQGFLVATCAPAASEATLSFASLTDLLDQDADEKLLCELPEPQREALEVALLRRTPVDRSIDHRTVAAATLSTLRILAADRGPLIIAVDDLQWLDRSSALTLTFALRRMTGVDRIGVLGTLRSGQGVGGELTEAVDQLGGRVIMAPLDLTSLGQVIAAKFGVKLSPPVLRNVHAASRGNTFLALEIAQAVVERGLLAEPGVPLRAPPDLEHALRARLTRLPGSTRHALLLASALWRPTERVITKAMGADATLALSTAGTAGIIDLSSNTIRFAHPLFASTLYGDAEPDERREVHRQLSTVVADIEERARHLALSAEGPDREIAEALDHAAARALSSGAPAAAAELFELAAKLTPVERDDERLGRLIRSAETFSVSGDYARAIALLEPAARSAPPGPLRGEALWQLGEAIHLGYEDHARASSVLWEATAQPHLPIALAGRIRASLAWARATGDSDPEGFLREAVDLAEEAGDDAALARALSHLATVRMSAGHGVDHHMFHRAIAIDATLDSRVAYANALTQAGETTAAEGHYVDVLGVARDRGVEASIGDALAGLGMIAWHRGHLRDALEYLEDAASHWPTPGFEGAIATRVAAELGDVDRARELAESGLAASLASEHRSMTVRYLGAVGFLELTLGNSRAARQHLVRAWQLLRELGIAEPGELPFPADLVEADIAEGDLAGAEEVDMWLEERGRTLDRPLALAQASRGRALLLAAGGDTTGALGAIEGALEQHERIEVPLERARTLLALGSIRRRAGQRRAARNALGQALGSFEQLEAPLWADKARAELARIAGRRASEGDLTQAERRVAGLVAAGRTNREVADALFTSIRTVEGHLSSVYAKLGIHSRVELSQFAHLFDVGPPMSG